MTAKKRSRHLKSNHKPYLILLTPEDIQRIADNAETCSMCKVLYKALNYRNHDRYAGRIFIDDIPWTDKFIQHIEEIRSLEHPEWVEHEPITLPY